jgi:hypothetical protein
MVRVSVGDPHASASSSESRIVLWLVSVLTLVACAALAGEVRAALGAVTAHLS